TRGDTGVERSRRRSDRALLRPLRRAAAGSARALGYRSVRAHDQGRVGVRARRHRRQGAGLHSPQGCTEAHRGECAPRQPPVRMRCFAAVIAQPNGLRPEPLRAGIAAPTAAELSSWSTLPAGAEELWSQGARPLDPNAADQFYVRTFAEPSADVTGFLGGKPGLRNTTLSVKAAGQVTIRLAPGQDFHTIG